MKKVFLLQLSLLAVMLVGSNVAFGQSNAAVLGSRLIVKTPAELVGTKIFTDAASGTTAWAPEFPTVQNDTVVRGVTDSLGCSTLTIPPGTYNGKWVLIERGTCLFSDKAWNVQQAGGKGIIIYNQMPGADPIGMAQGSHVGAINIPVIMVSNPDGLAMNGAIDAGEVVTIGLTTWGFGYTHDLAIVPFSMPIAHSGAIPTGQLGTNGNPVPIYNFYSGGFVANTGLSSETNVALISNVTYTPQGGSATVVNHDSVAIGTIATTDSILGSFSTHVYNPSASSVGRFDFTYSISSTNTDANPFDNNASFSVYATDSIFCKGRWNNTLGKPYTNGATAFASADPLAWGPMFYVNSAPYHAYKVQFGVNDKDTSKHSLQGQSPIYVTLYRWVDGSGGAPLNGLIEQGECAAIGVCAHTFAATDSNDKIITDAITDNSGHVGTYGHIDATGWYWVVVDVNTTYLLDIDLNSNFFGRLQAAKGASVSELLTAPNFDYLSSGSNDPNQNTVLNIPFNQTSDIDSLGINSFTDLTPAVALHLSKNKAVGVSEVVAGKPGFSVYPNPAVGSVHVKLDLPTLSKTVWFNIIDPVGHSAHKEMRTNLQSQDITFSTEGFAAGQYLMTVLTDEGLMSLPFTVLNK